MKLADLLRHVPTVDVVGSIDRSVGHVTRDSRTVRPDSVFVAIVGAAVDGHDLVDGLEAAAVVVQRPVKAAPGVTVIQVADTRRALAEVAAAFYDHPGRRVQVVGVTGTNGKTTVTTLVEEALLHLGRTAARVGTTGTRVAGRVDPSSLTTPEAPALQHFLASLVQDGVETLAMEVSSIGLSQRRVDQIPFAVAAFTNLTQDHLDFHGDMDQYASAKARLFQELLGPPRDRPRAILYGDDPAWTRMDPPGDRWLYGHGEGCDVRIERADFDATGIAVRLSTPVGGAEVRSPMIGRHNALNLACAVSILLSLGIDLADACEGVGAVSGVPGRLEVVPDPAGRLVVVDYAHSPDALQHALRSVRELTRGVLWVVFGCGGDRDRDKRAKMGRVAEEGADRVVVTSDNPRTEQPAAILDDILAGLADAAVAHAEVDREAAIRHALANSSAQDTVLIAGKGHETYQEIQGVRHRFDDREVVRRCLRPP